MSGFVTLILCHSLFFKDTLREDCDSSDDCVRNCCVSTIIAPVFFVIFVLMAQFVLVNVVVAVLMKHLEVNVRLGFSPVFSVFFFECVGTYSLFSF